PARFCSWAGAFRQSWPPAPPNFLPSWLPNWLPNWPARSLRHHHVDQFVWDYHALHHARPAQQLLDLGIGKGALGQFLFGEARIHANFAAHAPIDLDHDFDLLLFGELRRILRPFPGVQALLVSEHFP